MQHKELASGTFALLLQNLFVLRPMIRQSYVSVSPVSSSSSLLLLLSDSLSPHRS